MTLPYARFSTNSNIVLDKTGEGRYRISIICDSEALSKGSRVFFNFEIKRDNQPDNAIYSAIPDLNNANLINHSVIGNSPDFGIGRMMIRFRFAKSFGLSSSSVISSEYHVFTPTATNQKYVLDEIEEEWCAIMGNWNKHYKTGETVSESKYDGNELIFDITNETKKWSDDQEGILEYYGLEMRAQNEGINNYDILFSNDNSLYNNVVVIHLS